jgi:hypothetical protein
MPLVAESETIENHRPASHLSERERGNGYKIETQAKDVNARGDKAWVEGR